MIDAHSLNGPAGTTTVRIARWTPGGCVWCGSTDGVETFRNEPRCGLCREKEAVIDEAKHFIGMYGLRPLGGTLASEDDEEREYRVTARDAREVLNRIRLEKLPDPAAVRKALRPRAAAAVSAAASTSTPAKAPTKKSQAGVSGIDAIELESRVHKLLNQLTTVDEQISALDGVQGLPARARMKDLERQRTTVLTTLAALEKARRRTN
ncbi:MULTISPECIES: hypothetical protein [Nocardiaceae]|uniref:Uncharacterized protein n=1 Tax=Rhodococcoides yunnanense TaxID=278209 RepID=A0ABU4BFD4_9NOCA|nr:MULTISPECIES: hypothetical protein [Rhodococcus]MDI9895029.1 hypothetical protein [Rhodococcus sp. IEGM 1381]MDV6262927.1 hypothetical protein [Rhodococcus yunnanensis]